MAPIIEVFFGVRGSRVSVDHGYALYGAVARVLETREDAWLHQLDQLGLHLLRGAYGSHGRLLLGPRTRFGLRLSAALIPKVLVLAGKRLVISGDSLQVGVGAGIGVLVPAIPSYRIGRRRSQTNGHKPPGRPGSH
jgi:CRISPR-associated protein Cas6